MSPARDVPYAKLVRDRIPEIIRSSGREPRVSVLDEAAYREALRDKLSEEVAEFLASGDPLELTDILEVVYALAHLSGHTPEDLEALRLGKREARGGFEERLYLESVGGREASDG